MKKKRIISLLLCVCFIVFQFPAVASASEERTTAGEPEKYALCVGINEYYVKYVKSDNWLEGCVNDANYMADNLRNRAGFKDENVTVLLNEDAALANIQSSIAEIAEKAESGDVFIMQYASHGYNWGDEDGNYNYNCGLCSYDKDYDDYMLAADLLQFPKGVKIIMIIDACHSSGLFKTEEDGTDDNKRSRDHDEEYSFDIAERVSDIIDEMESEQKRDKKGVDHVSSADIGWVTAAEYYQYSYDGGYYDADDWFYTMETKKGTDENMGGVFSCSFAWSWWSGDADIMYKGDGDSYFDAYEGWAFARTVCAEWGYTSCCKNIDVLRSVELGDAGNVDTREIIFENCQARTAKIGEPVSFEINAYDAEDKSPAVVSVKKVSVGDVEYSINNNVLAFCPETDGNYIFTIHAESTSTGHSADKRICVSVYLDPPEMLETTDIAYDSFTLNWKAVDNSEKYEVLIVDNSNLYTEDADYRWEYSNGTSYTAKKLQSERTYYVKVRAINNLFGEWSDVITIKTAKRPEPVDPVVTAPVGKTKLVYNGSKQTLITEGEAEGGTLIYAVVGPCAEDPEYTEEDLEDIVSTEIPKAKDAGIYWIYYCVLGDDFHNDMGPMVIKVEIAPKSVTSPTITLEKEFYIYDGKAKTPTVKVKDGNTVIPADEYSVSYSKNTAAGTASVKITDKAGGNYKVSGSKNFVIGKLEAEWYWNGGSAIAYFTCPTYDSFYASAKATVTSEITTANGCDKAGMKTYTATVTYNGTKYTSTNTETIKATGHNYGTPKWTWNGTDKATAVFTCTNDSSHTKTVNATVTNKITKTAGVSAAGSRVYTATVSLNGKSYTNTKTVNYYLFDKSVTGLQKYNNILYYTKNGVQYSFTGYAKYGNDWYYVVNGKVNTSTKDIIKGTVNGVNAWWFVSGGKVQFINSVEKNASGWFVIQDGKVNFNYTGFAKNSNGWWYCKSGKVDFNYKNVVKGTVNGESGWWFVSGGQVKFINSVEKNNNGWWCIQNGKVNFSFTGIAKNSNGSWYCKGGQVQFGFTGNIKYNGVTYKIKAGKVVN